MSARPVTRRSALARIGAAASAASLGAMPGAPARAATATAIRIGVAQPAVGTPPSFSASALAVAHAKGAFEDEFKADGIKIEWIFFKGAGPAVNEALTNHQLDFAVQGDLPAVVAKAAGLKTRLVLASGVRTNIYIGVPPDSPLKTVSDLRGKRVSPRYLQTALREHKLETYWPIYQANGKILGA